MALVVGAFWLFYLSLSKDRHGLYIISHFLCAGELLLNGSGRSPRDDAVIEEILAKVSYCLFICVLETQGFLLNLLLNTYTLVLLEIYI